MEQSTFLISDYISQNQQSNIDDLRENLFSKGILSKDYQDENLYYYIIDMKTKIKMKWKENVDQLF